MNDKYWIAVMMFVFFLGMISLVQLFVTDTKADNVCVCKCLEGCYESEVLKGADK